MLRTTLAKVKKPLPPYCEKKSISKPLILGAQTHREGSKKRGLQLGDPHPFLFFKSSETL
jgi:hypothetical protein